MRTCIVFSNELAESESATRRGGSKLSCQQLSQRVLCHFQDYQLRIAIYRCLLQLSDLLTQEQLTKIDLECFRFGDYLFKDDSVLIPVFLMLMAKVYSTPIITASDVSGTREQSLR